MLKKDITFEDLDGNPTTETFYFNLNKVELLELKESGGDLEGDLKRISASEDPAQVIAVFKKIIGMTVGKRSEDGKRFIKSEVYRDEFLGSEAFSALFWEMFTDANAAVAFISGVMPKDVMAKVDREEFRKATTLDLPPLQPPVQPSLPARIPDNPLNKEFKDYTRAELAELSQDEYDSLIRTLSRGR